MIFERRVYTLRPGTNEIFWQAQLDFNTTGPWADVIRSNNLCYLESVGSNAEQVVELHRFDSMDQWKALGEHIFKNMTGEYFAVARPLLLHQENSFFVRSPIDALTPVWAGGELVSPPEYDRNVMGDLSKMCVVEWLLDLRPGTMPLFWNAYRDLLSSSRDLALHNLLFAHGSLVGRLHRVLLHRWFPNIADAESFHQQLNKNPDWTAFTEAYRDAVVASNFNYTRLAPISWLRSMFEAPSA